MAMHCQMIQAGEIAAIVGDGERDGVGGTQYAGLWSLTSQHRVFNAFGNTYAGLLPSEIRGTHPTLDVLDEHTVALRQHANDKRPSSCVATYKISAPYYVDHTLQVVDRRDMRYGGCKHRELAWCCYMNSPEDSRLNFLSGSTPGNPRWWEYISPRHGVGSNIAPSYLRDDELEVWPESLKLEKYPPFHTDRIKERFDQPFYYGMVGHMAMILIFDKPRWLRFYCSPTGGGPSILPGKFCPAWDFHWIIPESQYKLGQEYTVRTRLVYKLFKSREDVLDEVKKAQDELGFEKV